MKLADISKPADEKIKILFHLLKRRKNNPTKGKKPKVGSFIDSMDSMAGYPSPESPGSVNPDTN